jgi:hypothetical protein
MTRKNTTPKTKPFTGRAAKRAYEQGIADAAEKIALLEADPAAIRRQARRRVDTVIDTVARTMPTPERQKITRYAKKGVR